MYIFCGWHEYIKNWASYVKKIFNKLGFSWVWNRHKIESNLLFGKIEKLQKCTFNRYLVNGFYLQCFLRKSVPAKFQKNISKFKLNFHRLAIKTGRYN